MGRDDDLGDRPRAKRNPSAPPPGGLKYDPTMPSHAYAAYGPTGEHHAVYADETTSSNRKRVKNDEWVPAPPPPSMSYANDDGMHMGVPTILHRSSSATPPSHTPPPPPPAPYHPFENHAASGANHTIFSEAPVVIESFTETERRRKAAAAHSNSSSGEVNNSAHKVEPASAASAAKVTNGAALWNSRSIASGTTSVYDVFFPSLTRTKDASNRNGARESKRRRRNNNGEIVERSGTRSSSRRTAASADDEVDMLRFTVDTFNLIPQGLVDRIEARLRQETIKKLIASHVDNWISRSGLDDQVFLQEITTLLNAYYPCTYPTILDEVLAAFVFRRPELMDRMLKSIIHRLQRTGESANPSKYPVIESFTRRCGAARKGNILKKDEARHDLACLTVLRLLLERNTEKFVLSPWIASCASCCSDGVLASMWRALLHPLVNGRKTEVGVWRVQDPLDQVFELLREEKQLARHTEGDVCRLSMTLITTIVQDMKYSDIRQSQVACEAFEIFFGRPTHSAGLIEDWIAFEESLGKSREGAIETVISLTVTNCTRLSVKKTNWFMKHMLSLVMRGTASRRLLEDLLVKHAWVLLGGVAKSEIEELQVDSTSSDSFAGTANESPTTVIVGNVSSNEKHAEDGVIVQLGLLLEFMRGIPGDSGAAFVRGWSEQWCAARVLVPWSYAWGIVTTALSVNGSHGSGSSPVDVAFLLFARQFIRHYVERLLCRTDAPQFLSRVARIIRVAVQDSSDEVATTICEGVFEAASIMSKSSPLAEKVQNAISAMLADQLSIGAERIKTGLFVPKSRSRLPLLRTLCRLVERGDRIGLFVRDHLLKRRKVDRVIIELISEAKDDEADASLQIMKSYVGLGSADSDEWRLLWTPTAVDALVAVGYRVRLSATRRAILQLLDAVSKRHDEFCDVLAWSLLKTCSRFCCGCFSQVPLDTDSENRQCPEIATEFADLIKIVLMRQNYKLLRDVGEFVHQRIASCTSRRGRWNHFLVLVLDRIVQLGWTLVSSTPRVVRLVLTPFDGGSVIDPSDHEVGQLRLLKSLGLAILANRPSRQVSGDDEAWASVAKLLVSGHMKSKLSWIASHSTCSTSAGLARSIILLCEDVRRSIHVAYPQIVP